MNSTSYLTMTDLELAAALMAATGENPYKVGPGYDLVEITFLRTEMTEQIAVEYAAKKLVLEVRDLARCRSWLYRQVREVRDSGSEVFYD